MPDSKSKSDTRDNSENDGLLPFYFPEYNRTIRSADLESATKELNNQLEAEAKSANAKEGEK